MRSITSLPIIIKGILTAEDGVNGLVVSNHAARLFDGAITAIEALSEVVDAVEGRCEVLMDGGIRRGIDVLKALALGAKAVLVGWPIYYGLAVDGEEGMRKVFEILGRELEFAMAMLGISSPQDTGHEAARRRRAPRGACGLQQEKLMPRSAWQLSPAQGIVTVSLEQEPAPGSIISCRHFSNQVFSKNRYAWL